MKTIFFSTKKYELDLIARFKESEFSIQTTELILSSQNADLAKGFEIICVSTADDISHSTLVKLKELNVGHICVRATGYDNVDMITASKLGINVYNVPDYGPEAIAEHSLLLILSLLRKLKQSINQLKINDFRIDGLIGEELSGKCIGILGTGKIGKALSKLLQGFNNSILAHDKYPDYEWAKQNNVEYVSIEKLCSSSDILSLHIPLNNDTFHLLNNSLFNIMKKNILLINTARGAVLDTDVLIEKLKTGKISGAALDVYEFEKGIFFYDHQKETINDNRLKELLDMENVLITPHQAFATNKAIRNILQASMYNIKCAIESIPCKNQVKEAKIMINH